jgi:formamidopyrimidine-DNA glycosylase
MKVMVGRRVTRARLLRADFCTTEHGGAPTPAELFQGQVVQRAVRHGKQLALVADTGHVLLIHLGMTGQVRRATPDEALILTHIHATWELEDGSQVIFRDPRRFGGLCTYTSLEAVRIGPWSRLGPDGLKVTNEQLGAALRGSRRAVKAALLDQAVVAGVGNIYADEALFQARIAPARLASRLRPEEVGRLGAAIRAVLRHSIAAGGSTLRDYVDVVGARGRQQLRLLVYGRGGEPCVVCNAKLTSRTIAQRTTVFCKHCQAATRAQ